MNNDIRLKKYISILQNIYGDALTKMVLYGSYARDEANEYSDVDIMVFLDVPPEDERAKISELLDVTFDFNMDNDIDIQPVPKSNATFKKWENVLPFYKAVNEEGVVIYAR